jgi:perosamine synthetase
MSYYPNKHVTTGEGGMILSNDDQLAERCRALRNLCFGTEHRFCHEELGTNARMSNVQAAIGVAQYERLGQAVQRKREIGLRYQAGLEGHPWLQLPVASTEYAENIYWIFGLLLHDDAPIDAAGAMQRLAEKKIGTRPFFWGMHEQPVFRKMGLFEGLSCPVTETLSRRGFYVPAGLGTTDAQIDEVIQTMHEVLK